MDADALKTIILLLIVLLAIDTVWLFIRYDYHVSLFESVQKSPLAFRMIPAFGVYSIMAILIYLYAVRNALNTKDAAYKGTLLGALIYLFYDLTNYATLTKWTIEMVLVDSAWGAFLCGSVAAIGFYITQ